MFEIYSLRGFVSRQTGDRSAHAAFRFSVPGLLALFLLAGSARLFAQTPTPVPVPTWRYDNTHAGQNTNETLLTPSNVHANSFGRLFYVTVDSTVFAQPLYVPGLKMSDGLLHNVFFVATENDSIYAFDADSNTGANANPLWHITLLDSAHGAGPGATPVPPNDQQLGLDQGDIGPTIGITGTPVINPATNTMYVVGNTMEGGSFFSRLHAINILTGAEQSNSVVQNSPVEIAAKVPGTGGGSVGGQVPFNALLENQRTALDYYNGHIYFGYAAHGDNGQWHGWLFAYDATTLVQTAAVCLSPNDNSGGGVWGAGAGFPIVDDSSGGHMFVSTANGPLTLHDPPFNANPALGESVVNFSLANGGIAAVDAFTAFNANYLNTNDIDLGSGGVLLIPDQESPNPHILIQEGKEGRINVLNRDHLGGYAAGAASNTNILQDIPNASQGYWGTPAYWNGKVYVWASGDVPEEGQPASTDVPKIFDLDNGVLNTTPSSQSTISSANPGASFSISSNGSSDGIAWAVRTDQFITYGTEVLYAWDANSLNNLLFESDSKASDTAGQANKFSIPVVTNGKVYISGDGRVTVYGLLGPPPTAAAATISPNGGTFSTSQTVTLSSTVTPAQIFYTLDGSTPTTKSTLYAGPISVTNTTTVTAIVVAPGYAQSPSSKAIITIEAQTPAVALIPAAGTYTAAQQITLSDTDATATIFYTTDGSTPTTSSNLYTGPIQVTASETINAIAVDSKMTNSIVSSAAYVIQPTFSFSATPPPAIVAGSAATSTVAVASGNGFAGTVVLSCALTSGPSGAVSPPTCAVLQPIALTAGATATEAVAINTAANTSPGNYALALTATSGALSQTAGVAITVAAPAFPTFSLSGTTLAALAAGASGTSTITLTPASGFTGSVALTCAIIANSAGVANLPTCTTTQPSAITGTGPVSATLTINTLAATTPGSYTATVTGTSGSLSATTTVAATVTAPAVSPTFALSGTAVDILTPGSSAASTITVTPNGGFAGNVTIACAVTSSPAGAVYRPTCEATQPPPLSGSGSVTATVLVHTTGQATAALHTIPESITPLGRGGTFLAVLLVGLLNKRRKWRTLLGLVLLVAAVSAIGCGGSGTTVREVPQTSAGNYTLTVTGTSGAMQATATVDVTVE